MRAGWERAFEKMDSRNKGAGKLGALDMAMVTNEFKDYEINGDSGYQ